MGNCKPSDTPMAATDRLSKVQGIPLTEKESTHYRSIVGALQYLTITRRICLFQLTESVNIFMRLQMIIGQRKTNPSVLERYIDYGITYQKLRFYIT